MNIRDTLKERGDRYGDFADHARICQDLKSVMADTPSWNRCSPDKRQALEVIADKIARILNGDPDYDDNWIDIIGYSQLVLDELHGLKEHEGQMRMDFGIESANQTREPILKEGTVSTDGDKVWRNDKWVKLEKPSYIERYLQETERNVPMAKCSYGDISPNGKDIWEGTKSVPIHSLEGHAIIANMVAKK